MHKFPNVLPIVEPLYPKVIKAKSLDVPESHKRGTNAKVHPFILEKTRSEDAKHSITFDPIIQFEDQIQQNKGRPKMYQQVSTTVPIHENGDNLKQHKNLDNNLKANSNVPPKKPPRRIKLQKSNQKKDLINDHKTYDNNKSVQNQKNSDDLKIDIDDINKLSFDNSEKNFVLKDLILKDKVSKSVQVSLNPPYRLRIFPKKSRKVKSDPEKFLINKDRIGYFCITISRIIFSQFGLALIILIWALLGAAAFYETEGPREREQAEELSILQHSLAVSLATELRQVVPHEPVWLGAVQQYFARHEQLLLTAVSSGYGEGGGGGHIWTYPGCLLFAVSLLTTLGFGAPVPRTTLGRASAVLFSAIGIPLHFLLVLNFGVFLASKFQKLVSDKKTSKSPNWLKYFPVISIGCYFTLGTILFGFIRQRNIADSVLFPLEFTAAGGVAKTFGYTRILYALYLETAVILAATIVALFRTSASQGILNLGLRFGLLTNS